MTVGEGQHEKLWEGQCVLTLWWVFRQYNEKNKAQNTQRNWGKNGMKTHLELRTPGLIWKKGTEETELSRADSIVLLGGKKKVEIMCHTLFDSSPQFFTPNAHISIQFIHSFNVYSNIHRNNMSCLSLSVTSV